MKQNRARFNKADYTHPLERCYCEGDIMPPPPVNPDEEWLILEEEAIPEYDIETEIALGTYSKVDGKSLVSYTVEKMI